MVFETVCCGKATFGTEKICGVCKKTDVSSLQVIEHSSPVKKSPAGALCIRLTSGNLVKDYSRNSLLHVGISDSKGAVWHWNETGLHNDRNGWECVGIKLEPLSSLKPEQLKRVALESVRSKRYTQLGFNCFAFAVDVINALELSIADYSSPYAKVNLVEGPVGNAMSVFESWRAITHKVLESPTGYIVLDVPQASHRYTCDGCVSTIAGIRWHCNDCEDFDLCNACHERSSSIHDESHTFAKMEHNK
eukprot:CAMPEP_0204822830 /NCGR_PEP_ID=MMETSP1346-20131115/1018_1 /ASSEMBLY_ACC=CAM_ASM_000771 /TAXON_ID=215587 /ORGANISM="Aplanochytrium stocchinoi, Strain GSBS06" /LENGTH=247 /DNA_ID=CAMNT_0051949261 /DNA_START=88 /DNA_END=831 /DNA_ORIENTATION=-